MEDLKIKCFDFEQFKDFINYANVIIRNIIDRLDRKINVLRKERIIHSMNLHSKKRSKSKWRK